MWQTKRQRITALALSMALAGAVLAAPVQAWTDETAGIEGAGEAETEGTEGAGEAETEGTEGASEAETEGTEEAGEAETEGTEETGGTEGTEETGEAETEGTETEELVQLAAPTDLTWGDTADGAAMPGIVGWKVSEEGACQNHFLLNFYSVEDEAAPVGTTLVDCGTEEQTDFECDYFIKISEYEDGLENAGNIDDGTYYFTVQSIGDGIEYSSSEVVRSDTWTYEEPEDRLPVLSEPVWEWPCATWTEPEDPSGIYGYEVGFYYSEKEAAGNDDRAAFVGSASTVGAVQSGEISISDAVLEANGGGYYYFRIRALSNDITQYRNSEWSGYSPAYYLAPTMEEVKEALQDILEGLGEEDDAGEKVAELDQTVLRSAMLSDDEILDLVSRLEATKGIDVGVEVDSSLENVFSEENVSMVGAALNDTGDAERVTLRIGEPNDAELVIPELYQSTAAIRFSINTEGIENAENLSVPVRITLPVPDTIRPDFLAILHYAKDGAAEILKSPDGLYIHQEDGQYYVSFVVDHFNDFVLTESKENAGSDDTESPGDDPDGDTQEGGGESQSQEDSSSSAEDASSNTDVPSSENPLQNAGGNATAASAKKLLAKVKVTASLSIAVGTSGAIEVTLPAGLSQVGTFTGGDGQVKISFKSRDKKIAQVDSDGKVTGISEGSVLVAVTVALEDGTKQSLGTKVTVKLGDYYSSLLKKATAAKSLTVKKGKSKTIKVTLPAGLTKVKRFTGAGGEVKITYKSAKKKVASVNSKGKVIGKKKGASKIKATLKLSDGTKRTLTIKVKVK